MRAAVPALALAAVLAFGSVSGPVRAEDPVDGSGNSPALAQLFPTSTPVPPEEQYQGDTSRWPVFALVALVPVALFLGFLFLFRRYSRRRD